MKKDQGGNRKKVSKKKTAHDFDNARVNEENDDGIFDEIFYRKSNRKM